MWRIIADGSVELLKGIQLHRSSVPTEPIPRVWEPALGVIAQGSKAFYLDKACYHYGPGQYCLGTVELPVVSHVIEASPERPYLSFRLTLDPDLVGPVMLETGYTAPRSQANAEAIHVSDVDADLLDAVVRLLRLLDRPKEASFLAPMIKREIVYRLLLGNQGDRLRHIAILSGYTSPIATAIEQLRTNFDESLRIDDLAQELGMSVSGLHHNFKAVTGFSPLQFQKRFRLQEARRLMLNEQLDAASAAYRVGYDNASQFSREYKRLFGLPPMRDVERLRGTTGQNSALATV
jgi:AraC-like DNA-binding protein